MNIATDASTELRPRNGSTYKAARTGISRMVRPLGAVAAAAAAAVAYPLMHPST